VSAAPTPHDAPAVPRWLAWSLMIGLGVGIWLIDAALERRPEAIEPWGWRLLAIFAPTILGLMLRPLPGGVIVLFAVTLIVVCDAVPIPADTPSAKRLKAAYEKALAGYAHASVWLVLAAYFMSRALIKTGLARRIALTFVRLLGKNTLGLSYAIVATDTVLAGLIPSNAARVGGVILPVTRSLAELYRSHPGASAGLLGTFLMAVLYQADVVACALFLTGQASNPLAADTAYTLSKGRVTLTYGHWFLYALAPALVSLLVVPWLVYRLCRPAITHTPEATEMAKRELAAMGPMSRGEWIMLSVFIGVCTGWIVCGYVLGPDSTALVALLGAGVLFLCGVLTWEDAVTEKGAWDVFIWYGGLVQMGTLLNEAHVTDVFAQSLAGSLQLLALPLVFLILLLIYFYAHYGFASITAHMLSMFPAFVGVLLALGASEWLVLCVFAYFGNLCAGLTHYGTTPAPIVFGTGYVSHGAWWKIGFLMSLVNVTIWLAVGLPWWKLWGLW
jgi:DASS family divalent anion:Na+ symporter